MSTTTAIIEYAKTKMFNICEELKDKEIPNWWKIQDVEGFGFRVTEGDLNFQVGIACYPVEEEGPGHFLVRLNASFLNTPVKRQGYEFLPTPQGPVCEMDFAVYAEDNKDLVNGVLQIISDEAENILCQILE